MAWLTPKTNWLSTDYINAADFNRIEGNINFVANYMNSNYFRQSSFIDSVTNRSHASLDFISSINRVEGYLTQLVSKMPTPIGWQTPKTWSPGMGFYFSDANRLESSAQQLSDTVTTVVANYRMCGTQICGNNWGLIS